MIKPPVLILGSGSDLGAQIAAQYVARDHPVYLLGRNLQRLDRLRHSLSEKASCPVVGFVCDVTDYTNFVSIVANLNPFPGIVIVTAGVMSRSDPADMLDIQELMRINAEGPSQCLQHMASEFELRDIAGVLVGVSSLAGERGRASNYAYGASKAAFTTFLSGLRHRYHGTGLHVMTVLPGFIRTKMISGLETPGFLTTSPDKMASRILLAIERRENVVYPNHLWRLIRLILVFMPESMFKRSAL